MGLLRVVAGRWRGRQLSAGSGRSTAGIRPTADRVRTSLFDRLMPMLDDARVLDLCAGTGALGIEALSRGASHVTFVERSASALRLIEANLATLGLTGSGDAIVRRDEALHGILALQRAGESFDLILADPPYDGGLAGAIVQALDESSILASGGWLVVEHERRQPLPAVSKRVEHLDERIYGDTCLTFFRGTRDEDSSLSGDV